MSYSTFINRGQLSHLIVSNHVTHSVGKFPKFDLETEKFPNIDLETYDCIMNCFTWDCDLRRLDWWDYKVLHMFYQDVAPGSNKDS